MGSCPLSTESVDLKHSYMVNIMLLDLCSGSRAKGIQAALCFRLHGLEIG
jgi:hypothetical protein